MTLDKFKNMVNELYMRETRSFPNFSLIKNAFEYLDLRKDGVIDLNEWSKSLTMAEVSLKNNNTKLFANIVFFRSKW